MQIIIWQNYTYNATVFCRFSKQELSEKNADDF